MKKVLKISGISLGSLIVLILLALFLIPLLFKDKLTNMAKDIINDNLNAVVDFESVDISIFRHFPKVTVSLKNLSVVSKNEELASV
ncbi:MAG: AsmA family protein, partial [Prevotellaceae bacterium]|nr:AsmA family protein [Prevotellaceae bacterium]